MIVHLAADHRGFQLKETLKVYIESMGHTVVDHGSAQYDAQDDYPDMTYQAAKAVSANPEARGIVLCGSGVGVSIVANKVPGVRCVLGFTSEQVAHARGSDNCTVLALPADFIDQVAARALTDSFLTTSFENDEADVRRIEKVATIESELEK